MPQSFFTNQPEKGSIKTFGKDISHKIIQINLGSTQFCSSKIHKKVKTKTHQIAIKDKLIKLKDLFVFIKWSIKLKKWSWWCLWSDFFECFFSWRWSCLTTNLPKAKTFNAIKYKTSEMINGTVYWKYSGSKWENNGIFSTKKSWLLQKKEIRNQANIGQVSQAKFTAAVKIPWVWGKSSGFVKSLIYKKRTAGVKTQETANKILATCASATFEITKKIKIDKIAKKIQSLYKIFLENLQSKNHKNKTATTDAKADVLAICHTINSDWKKA